MEAAMSLLVSKTLDDLGYSQQIVKLRQRLWADIGHACRDGYVMIVGSKAEGLTRFSESDIDVMDIDNDIISTSNPVLHNNNERATVFKTDRTNSAPGYTRLILTKVGTKYHCNQIQASLTEPISGNIYLSSDSWRERSRSVNARTIASLLSDVPELDIVGDQAARMLTRIFTMMLTRMQQLLAQGPSNPFSFVPFVPGFDLVTAIICECPDILESWIMRPRRYNWPSAAVIQEVSSLEAHVVPIGFKGSVCQFIEWRICFTRAEIKLIHNLNDCQIKLIILLKMIGKSSLKPVCKTVTTYVMKNIVLWMAESFPADYFRIENLFPALKLALRFLRECLVARYLPSYMIPERNLLVNRIDRKGRSRLTARTRLCAMIDILLAEGQRMFMRCEKIKNAWNILLTSSKDMYLYSNRGIDIEMALLCLVQRLKNGDCGELEIMILLEFLNVFVEMRENGEWGKMIDYYIRFMSIMK